jgi:hypothetical protein
MGPAVNGRSGLDRRCSPRRGRCGLRRDLTVRLRSGHDLALLNLSSGGALVEGSFRALPGTTVELQLLAPGWRGPATARVLRCDVVALHPSRGVRYRAALAFAVGLTMPDEPAESDG